MASPLEWLEISRINDIIVARIVKPDFIDEQPIKLLGERLERIGRDPQCQELVLDFVHVTRLSTAVLAMLISFQKKFQAGGGRLALSGLKPELQEVFVTTRLDRIFKIYPTAGEAVRSFKSL